MSGFDWSRIVGRPVVFTGTTELSLAPWDEGCVDLTLFAGLCPRQSLTIRLNLAQLRDLGSVAIGLADHLAGATDGPAGAGAAE